MQKKVPFDVQKEKGVFFSAQNEFMDRNRASIYADFLVFNDGLVIEMPPSFDQSLPRKLTENVSILKNFLKICLSLVKNKYSLVEVSNLIEEPHTSL